LNGWLTAVNAKGGREKGGDLGPIQGNPPEAEAAVRLGRRGHGGWDRPPDVREVPKGHGRLRIRELWLEESAERGADLEAEDGGPGLRFGGVIRRRRCRLSRRSEPEAWVESEPIGVAGASVGRRRAREVLGGRQGR
jgi:hypothetical protein